MIVVRRELGKHSVKGVLALAEIRRVKWFDIYLQEHEEETCQEDNPANHKPRLVECKREREHASSDDCVAQVDDRASDRTSSHLHQWVSHAAQHLPQPEIFVFP
jgi:hypothetical protein